ncbi:MAG: helix-turn-helix transcriptional regulator [Bacteroidota bacterium]
MKERPIPIESFFGNDHIDLAFRIFEMKPRSTPSSLDPHRHDFYEIFVFEEGAGEHSIDFTDYEIANRTLHFVAPGQVHWVQRSLDSHGYLIAFSLSFFSHGEKIEDLLSHLPFFHSDNEPSLTFEKPEFDKIKSLCSQLFHELSSRKTGMTELLRAYLKILLIECKRHVELNPGSPSTTTNSRNSEFQLFRKEVERNFRSSRQVQDYTAALGYSHQKLNELVKEKTGKTVLEFIHQRLILEAKRLLFFSDNSIKEVAYTLNFEDPSNFSKFFKSKTGYSPNQIRQGLGLS